MSTKFNPSAQYRFLLALFVSLLLISCAQMGITTPAPKNTEQRLVYAQSGLTAAYRAVADLVVQGRITIPQRDDAVAALNKGYIALTTAKIAMQAGDIGKVDTSLGQAQDVLMAVESVLKSIGAK